MVDEVSVLECNVSTGSLNTAGKISGDIVAEQNVELDESAMVIGNINRQIDRRERGRQNRRKRSKSVPSSNTHRQISRIANTK